jgi:hypothetical protein
MANKANWGIWRSQCTLGVVQFDIVTKGSWGFAYLLLEEAFWSQHVSSVITSP